MRYTCARLKVCLSARARVSSWQPCQHQEIWSASTRAHFQASAIQSQLAIAFNLGCLVGGYICNNKARDLLHTHFFYIDTGLSQGSADGGVEGSGLVFWGDQVESLQSTGFRTSHVCKAKESDSSRNHSMVHCECELNMFLQVL